jgi:predicted ATPase/DNA-binding XRE family transcriptional regulator
MEGEEKERSDFGSILRRHRLALGLSQEALAERAGLSLYGISALERGYRRTPQRETLVLLAAALALNEEQRQAFEAAAARPSSPRHRGSAPVTAGPWPSARIPTLPLALTNFIGREAELEQIRALLCKHRLVTITGAGGVGKTQTVLQAAIGRSESPDGDICFVALAVIRDPSLVVAAIAAALGVQEVPSYSLLDSLLSYLKNRTTLLILDNCEHVVQEAAVVVNAVLLGCPRLRILATSREPLGAAGERRFRLPSLKVDDAVKLFVDRAQAAEVKFALTNENQATVAEICRHLDGMPLAIELAAARVNMFPVQMLAKNLNDRFVILSGGVRTALPRQRTMRAAIDWSYDLLSPQEQRFFERLSVFAGGCTLATATTVCSGDGVAQTEVFELLLSLIEKSVVTVDAEGREPRYGLLESFREYAREKLMMRGQQRVLAHRHARACLSLAEELRVAWDTQPDREWTEAARAEMANWLQALEFSLAQQSDVTSGQSLVAALAFAWMFVLGPVEGRRWSTVARDLIGEDTPPEIIAGLSHVDLWIANAFEEHERELAASSAALEAYKGLSDEFGMVIAEAHVVRALVLLGQTAEVEDAVMAALARARRLGLHKLLAYVLRIAGTVSMAAGDLSKARAHIAEAEAIAQACGAERQLALAGHERAECEFLAGNAKLALEYASEALRYARSVKDITLVARGLVHTSWYLFSLARYEAAEEHAREALVIGSSQGAVGIVNLALQRLASVAAARQLLIPQHATTDCARAARILGFLNRRFSAVAASTDFKLEHDCALNLLERTMDGVALEKLMSEGGTLTTDQAIHLALSR